MLRPPCVLHIRTKEEDDRMELIQLCSSSLHFSKGEEKLLEYYANCKSGFRPSQELVANKIDVDRRHVAKLRARLVERGIALSQDNKVFIDWERIRLFSTLDPDMTSKHCTVSRVELQRPSYLRYLEVLYSSDSITLVNPDKISEMLNDMTEDDYKKLCNYIKKHSSKMPL